MRSAAPPLSLLSSSSTSYKERELTRCGDQKRPQRPHESGVLRLRAGGCIWELPSKHHQLRHPHSSAVIYHTARPFNARTTPLCADERRKYEHSQLKNGLVPMHHARENRPMHLMHTAPCTSFLMPPQFRRELYPLEQPPDHPDVDGKEGGVGDGRLPPLRVGRRRAKALTGRGVGRKWEWEGVIYAGRKSGRRVGPVISGSTMRCWGAA